MWDESSVSLEELVRKNQIILTQKQRNYLKVKRILDFIIALIALILLLPILLIVTIAIKIESPHEHVMFKQRRIGQNGIPFTLYKFRSMKQGTPEVSTTEFVEAENYITKIGKILRKTSLDELPQLWCVLTGKMSLMGERPLILQEDEVHYLRNYYGIYQLKPGITGLAQINGRDTMGDYEKVRWDRAYVHNVSFAMDFSIFLQTVKKVLKSEGVVDEAEKKKNLVGATAYVHTEILYGDGVYPAERELASERELETV